MISKILILSVFAVGVIGITGFAQPVSLAKSLLNTEQTEISQSTERFEAIGFSAPSVLGFKGVQGP